MSEQAIIEADKQRIDQLIHNLLQNALVHTPAGTSVDVRVERSGNQIALRVRDEGPGLDEEQANRVFDRFYRGTTSGRESGSGLGLFIVATVAKSLGGHVSVDTAPGKGASFTVVLPALGVGMAGSPGARAGADAGLGANAGPGVGTDAGPGAPTGPASAGPLSDRGPTNGGPAPTPSSTPGAGAESNEAHEPGTVRH